MSNENITKESLSDAIADCWYFPPLSENKGWMCPVCGCGVAPWQTTCPCKKCITYACGDDVTNGFPYY